MDEDRLPCKRHHHHFDGQGFYGPADTESMNASEPCPGYDLALFEVDSPSCQEEKHE